VAAALPELFKQLDMRFGRECKRPWSVFSAPKGQSEVVVKRRIAVCVIFLGAALALSACTNPYDPGQRFVGGGLLGAGAGAAIGAAAGGGPGAALGAAIGGATGAIGGVATTPPPPPYAYYGYPAYSGYPGYGYPPPPGYYGYYR
jgi:hypothetical protein